MRRVDADMHRGHHFSFRLHEEGPEDDRLGRLVCLVGPRVLPVLHQHDLVE